MTGAAFVLETLGDAAGIARSGPVIRPRQEAVTRLLPNRYRAMVQNRSLSRYTGSVAPYCQWCAHATRSQRAIWDIAQMQQREQPRSELAQQVPRVVSGITHLS